MTAWTNNLHGRFIVFDGPDGSGKSTQFARFAAYGREHGLTVQEVREPGGTDLGEKIRTILLDPANAEMTLRCEMLLYMASRAQLIEQRVQPAVAAGELVLADRFISSTLAYQGAGGGLGEEEIMAVGRAAVRDTWPDLTVIFDVDEKTASHRMGGKKHTHEPTLFSDRMERKDIEFRARVRQSYLDQAAAHPDRYVVIDARGGEDAVFEALLGALSQRFA